MELQDAIWLQVGHFLQAVFACRVIYLLLRHWRYLFQMTQRSMRDALGYCKTRRRHPERDLLTKRIEQIQVQIAHIYLHVLSGLILFCLLFTQRRLVLESARTQVVTAAFRWSLPFVFAALTAHFFKPKILSRWNMPLWQLGLHWWQLDPNASPEAASSDKNIPLKPLM